MLLNLWIRMRNSLLNRRGIGTIEMLIILLVLVTIAFLFRDAITGFFNMLMEEIRKIFEGNL